MISAIANFSGWTYRNAVKPVFFRFPADRVHEVLVGFGEVLGATSPSKFLLNLLWSYQSNVLRQEVAGINFKAPIGLAAGFDYNAQLTQVTPSLGFGWHSVGTVTHGAYEGNKPPMLGRLPHSRSLWVNKGFKNPGASAIINKLSPLDFDIPVGISVGATNKQYTSAAEQVEEYVRAFKELENSTVKHSYYELNISCPNLSAGTNFQEPTSLRSLLQSVTQLKLSKPVFVKMPIDIDDEVFLSLVDEIASFSLAGIIVGNLTKDYDNPHLFKSEAQRFIKGGFSGKPTFSRSNHKIRLAYKHAGDSLAIVGTGGIFTAQDAYYKIRCGASLLQMITGLIYQGPQVVGQINRDLARLLENDGFTNISEAVGVE